MSRFPQEPGVEHPHDQASGFQRLATNNAVYRRLLERARTLADDDRPLLVWGEPGTGKDTLAECIHQASDRRQRAFTRVTAMEIAVQLSSLERHPPGEEDNTALRALRARLGVARGGTLLVQGIEELSVPSQAKLLRTMLGDRRAPVVHPSLRELRLIGTVRRSLASDVRRGLYRADLYRHLGLEVLHVPPLRERREDIELLATQALWSWPTPRRVTRIDPQAMHHLRSYDYPYNVSELETIMELALRAERSAALSSSALPSHVRQGAAAERKVEAAPVWRTLEEVQAEYTRQVLEHTRGNRSEAARILGISRTGLLCKIRRYGIDVPPRDDNTHRDQ
jgi:DNA-binding NtrC family response regulator